MKNKPKIGNLTQEQAQRALAGNCNKTNTRQVNYLEKDGSKSEKHIQSEQNFIKRHPHAFWNKLNQKICHKI